MFRSVLILKLSGSIVEAVFVWLMSGATKARTLGTAECLKEYHDAMTAAGTAVAEQSKLLPVTRHRARVRFLQLRPAEIVL